MDALPHLVSSMNQFRVSANSFLSQYEPLALLFAPIISLLLAGIFRLFIGVIQEKGLKATILGVVVSFVKLVPGVERYIDSEKQKVVEKLQASGKSKRDSRRSELPQTGLGVGVIEKMKDEKQKDVVWQSKCSDTLEEASMKGIFL